MQHCSMNVEKVLSAIDGVKGVSVDLAKKTATIKYKGEIAEEAIKQAIESIGFVYAGKVEA